MYFMNVYIHVVLTLCTRSATGLDTLLADALRLQWPLLVTMACCLHACPPIKALRMWLQAHGPQWGTAADLSDADAVLALVRGNLVQ